MLKEYARKNFEKLFELLLWVVLVGTIYMCYNAGSQIAYYAEIPRIVGGLVGIIIGILFGVIIITCVGGLISIFITMADDIRQMKLKSNNENNKKEGHIQ